MADDKKFVPFVPPEKSIAEFTLAAVILGVVLGAIMTAANTYAGLYAGMTVTASIPAAVISMGVLRGVLGRGTILENNVVQTIASAGESLAAGIIFTIPAIVIVGIWQDFKFWPVTIIAISGGLLGVLFMIPLRRTLIIEEKELIYPEGLACAEVLEVGETKGSGVVYIFSALGLGVVFKHFVAAFGIIRGTVEGAWTTGKTAMYFGCDMSVLLLGIGYIVGMNIGVLVFIGGAIGWLVGIPIYGAVRGFPAGDSLVDSAYTVWSTQIRYMGVGAMIVGGLWSIIRIRSGIAKGLRDALFGRRLAAGAMIPRTEQDLKQKLVLILSVVTIISVFSIYLYLTPTVGIALVSTVAMVLMGFFFVAVSSYIVGLVGSSNNPISGMTICTILFTSALLLLSGMSGNQGILAALGVAGVVCCAAATAGDISQDLKTGYLVGATPRSQQMSQILGVVLPAFVIAPVLTVLQKAYGIGSPELPAPQATLFASIASAMFTEASMPWGMVKIGAGIGIVLVIADEILRNRGAKFRAHVMPVAVGIYLPLGLAVPIFVGGATNLVTRTIARRRGDAESAVHRGVLFSSGLIAGEAIMGIILAFLIVGGVSLPWPVISWLGSVFESIGLPFAANIFQNTISLFFFGIGIAALVYVALKRERTGR
ncbi:MAG: oligopeptide transporter, OPT family [Candidatus Eisenbacteria bacterium]